MTKQYHLFISHSWSYDTNYQKLIDMLNGDPTFHFSDYSVPKDDPIHTNGTDKELRIAIENKIKPCCTVLILAGVYATYSKWINNEIEISQQYGKSIVAIEPWGAEKTSIVVKDAADKIVKWNTASIIGAIRELNK